MRRTHLMGAAAALFLFSQAAQAQWTPPKRLTWNPGNSSFPDIAVDSWGTIHAVWLDDTLSEVEVYYKKSTDGGTNWTANKRLTWSSEIPRYPAIARRGSLQKEHKRRAHTDGRSLPKSEVRRYQARGIVSPSVIDTP